MLSHMVGQVVLLFFERIVLVTLNLLKLTDNVLLV